jgi:hypothetical protein
MKHQQDAFQLFMMPFNLSEWNLDSKEGLSYILVGINKLERNIL